MNDSKRLDELLGFVNKELDDFLGSGERGLSDMFEITPDNIEEEFRAISGNYAYYLAVAADANKAYLQAKAEFTRVESQLFLEIRETNKGTLDQIWAMVRTDPRYMEAKYAFIDAEISKDRTKGIAEAIRAKKDMLVSLGAFIRAEMQSVSVRQSE